MAEFMNTSASGLSGTYLDTTAQISKILKPGEISRFLVLGNAWNVQLGYVTKSGYAIDIRYENLEPEFKDQAASALQQAKVSTVGLGKYFNDNKLKIQAMASSVEYANKVKALKTELMFQVVF